MIAHAPNASSPAPAATPAAAPITDANAFLHALITSNFNAPDIASRLTPQLLLKFTHDPRILDRLSGLLAFNSLCLQLRQSQARHVALVALQSLVESLDPAQHHAEKRRAATSLLRATTPAPFPKAGTTGDDQEPAARPQALPRADLTAQEVAHLLLKALREPDAPQEHGGLATIAAFADHDATVNREPLDTDDPGEVIDELLDSDLTMCRAHKGGVYNTEPRIDESTASFDYDLHLPTFEGTLRLWVKLTRRADSKHPGCWLIRSLSTGPPNAYTLPGEHRRPIPDGPDDLEQPQELDSPEAPEDSDAPEAPED